jgi:hypothetical protein
MSEVSGRWFIDQEEPDTGYLVLGRGGRKGVMTIYLGQRDDAVPLWPALGLVRVALGHASLWGKAGAAPVTMMHAAASSRAALTSPRAVISAAAAAARPARPGAAAGCARGGRPGQCRRRGSAEAPGQGRSIERGPEARAAKTAGSTPRSRRTRAGSRWRARRQALPARAAGGEPAGRAGRWPAANAVSATGSRSLTDQAPGTSWAPAATRPGPRTPPVTRRTGRLTCRARRPLPWPPVSWAP